MARNASNVDIILQRVRARLIDQIDCATTATCWITDDPEAVKAGAPGDVWYTVAPGVSGDFSDPHFDGGGQSQALTSTTIAVTIHNIQLFDEIGRGESFYADDTKGMFDLAKPVIKALAGHDLQDTSSNEILAQPFFPRGYSVFRDPKTRLGSMQITFDTMFDWDLS